MMRVSILSVVEDFFNVGLCVLCSVADSCPTLCIPMDQRPPGSSVHGISQARILESVSISSSREYSKPKNRTHVSCISCIGRQVLYLLLSHLGKPNVYFQLSKFIIFFFYFIAPCLICYEPFYKQNEKKRKTYLETEKEQSNGHFKVSG